jgi:hypothetical protein
MTPVDQSVFVPAPDLPPGSRSALVIATSNYADSRLGQPTISRRCWPTRR